MEVFTKPKCEKIESFSISGMIQLIVDRQPLLSHRFEEYIKVEVIFDHLPKHLNPHEQECQKDGNSPAIERFHESKRVDEDFTIQNSDDFEEAFPDKICTTDFKGESDVGLKTESNHVVQSNSFNQNADLDAEISTVSSSSCPNEYQFPETSESTAANGKAFTSSNLKRKMKKKTQKKRAVSPESKAKSKVKLGTKKRIARELTHSKKPRKVSENTELINHPASKEKKSLKVKKLEMEKDVYCEFCHQWFKSQQEFFNHRKSERTSFTCNLCGKVVPFKAHLMVHLQKHNSLEDDGVSDLHRVGDLSYTISNKSTADQDNLSSKKGVKCEICGIIMSNIPILKTHMMIHTGEYAYKCCVCGEQSHSIGRFNNHMSTHLKTGRVQCKVCSLSFDSRGDLSKHQLSHEFPCNLCGQTFQNKTSRAFHYKTAHPHDILKCEQCGKLFSSDEELKSHLNYHRNRNKTQCTVCGLFVSRLENHLLSHNQKPEVSQMYVCDKCPKQFKQKLSFQRHLTTHSEERPYACVECPKRFARSGGLRRHMTIHTQEKPFVCDICGKACSQMGNLKIHMQIHKEPGPISCTLCGTGFSQKSVLQEHIKTVHFVDMNSLTDTETYFSNLPTAQVYYP